MMWGDVAGDVYFLLGTERLGACKQADQFVLLECPSGFRGYKTLQGGGSKTV